MAHIDLLQNDIATNPQSGYYRVYFKSDGFPYYRNNAGTETAFTVGSLSDYVTIATPQTITGAKTFSAAVNLGSVGSTSAVTSLAVDGSGNVVNGSALLGGQVNSVVGSTNITIGGSATAPQVDLNSAITGTSVNNVTLSDGGVATNFLNETGNYTTPVTPAISLQDAYDDSTTPEITTDATRGAVSIKRGSALDTDNVFEVQDGTGANTFRVTGEGFTSAIVFNVLNGGQLRLNGAGGSDISLNNDGTNKGVIYATETYLYLSHPTKVLIGATTIEASGNLEVIGDADISGTLDATGNTTVNTFIVNGTATLNSTLDVAGTITGSIAAGTQVGLVGYDNSGKLIIGTSTSDSLQDAYDASTTPEITTDATRGALTIKRGSALDSDNVLEVQNGAGTNVVQATAEGVVTIGDLTIIGPYNQLNWTTSGNTSFIQADYPNAGQLGIVSTNGVYIQADTNFGSSDVSGISNLNMSGTATIGGQILASGPITGSIAAGTQVGLVGYDSSGKLIIGTGNAGDAVLSATQTFTGVNTFSDNINASQLINHSDYPTGSTAIGNVWRDGDNLKFRSSTYTKNLTYEVGTDAGTGVTSLTIDTSIYTQFSLRNMDSNVTINAPINGLNDGQKLTIRLRDNGTSKTLSWDPTTSIFRAIGVTLPLSTTALKTLYVGCIYNGGSAKWDVVAVSEEA
tara:strand:- start:991 stop:3048 length:2058 start_codon:yes stop_codon:yes gene_type:complete